MRKVYFELGREEFRDTEERGVVYADTELEVWLSPERVAGLIVEIAKCAADGGFVSLRGASRVTKVK